MRSIAWAPSNIALIKYMGKEDPSINLPANSSISMTLDRLRTLVEIDSGSQPSKKLSWTPELPRKESLLADQNELPYVIPKLSEAGIDRMLAHIERVRSATKEIFPAYGIALADPVSLEVRTANTFPSASGIASSASSFAALTLATAIASSRDPNNFKMAWKNEIKLRRDLARVSRQGSGSSCRSFEGPFVFWEGEKAIQIEANLPKLTDLVLLISSASKEVSSSKAHLLVQTSPLWQGRQVRADQRIHQLKTALKSGNIAAVSKISWDEMWEMHSLFHTCETPFTYWEPETLRALKWVAPYLKSNSPPIVTLDAGANIHILVESTHVDEWKNKLQKEFSDIPIRADQQGAGASFI